MIGVKLKPLAECWRILDEELVQCVKCGKCMMTCPTYLHRPQEGSNARGKTSLIQAFRQGIPVSAKDVIQRVSLCSACMACETVCPNGVKTGKLFRWSKTLLASEASMVGKNFPWNKLARSKLTQQIALMIVRAKKRLMNSSNGYWWKPPEISDYQRGKSGGKKLVFIPGPGWEKSFDWVEGFAQVLSIRGWAVKII